MFILVDTQVFIWSVVSPEKISKSAARLLENEDIYLSHISLIEISIKQKIGKLPELSLSVEELIERAKKDNYLILPLEESHISTYRKVPLFENHRDPFDRLLIATAISEDITIISADEKFKLYTSLANLVW